MARTGAETIAGFDWDEGNRQKCRKHGVSKREVESVFDEGRPVTILPDVGHSREEPRFRAIGNTHKGRHVFVVFAIRAKGGKNYIRPISARYMHRKEVEHYEKENPGI